MHEPSADGAGGEPERRTGSATVWLGRMARRRLVVGTVIVLGGALLATYVFRNHHAVLKLSPEQTPALAVRWQTDHPVDQVVAVDPTVYLVSGNSIEARALASGRMQWSSTVGDPSTTVRHARTVPLAFGRHFFVALGSTLYALDRQTGAIAYSRSLAGEIQRLAGPPLIAHVSTGQGPLLLQALEPDRGQQLAQREVSAGSQLAAVVDGVAVLVDSRGGAIHGLDASTLAQRWHTQVARIAPLFEVDGRFYVGSADADRQFLVQELDVSTGELGPVQRGLLPPGDRPAELVPRRLGQGVALHRQPLARVPASWSTWLPCLPGVGAVHRGQLFLACDQRAGHSYVLKLDWRTGAIARRWYGLDEVRAFHFGSDLVMAQTASRVVAFASNQDAAPEVATKTLESAIDRILARVGTSEGQPDLSTVPDQVDALAALGEPALTPLLRRLPMLPDGAFAATAQILARARVSAAAPLIAQRATAVALTESQGSGASYDHAGAEPDLAQRERRAVIDALLRSLGRIGSDDGIAVASAILHDRRQTTAVRQRALRTLVQLRRSAADAVVIMFVERNRPTGRGRWWQPLEHWRRPAHQLGLVTGGDDDTAWRGIFALLGRHLVTADGSRWIVLRGGPLGDNGHLWLIQADASGVASGAFGLLGQRCPNRPVDGGLATGGLDEVGWNGDRLRLRCSGSDEPFAITPALALADRDGDGINDKAEELLHLNPLEADSDRDGIIDGEDLTPTGRDGEPLLERDQLVDAIVRERFGTLGDDRRNQPALIIHSSAHNWETSATPLLTYDEEELAFYCEATGCDDVPRLIVVPAPSCGASDNPTCRALPTYAAERELDPDERVVIRRLRGDPSGDQDAAVLVRKVGRFWVVEEVVVLDAT